MLDPAYLLRGLKEATLDQDDKTPTLGSVSPQQPQCAWMLTVAATMVAFLH